MLPLLQVNVHAPAVMKCSSCRRQQDVVVVDGKSHHESTCGWGTAGVSPVLFSDPEGPRHASLYATAGPAARENSGPKTFFVHRAATGTSPSRLALSAEVPGDFPQSASSRGAGPQGSARRLSVCLLRIACLGGAPPDIRASVRGHLVDVLPADAKSGAPGGQLSCSRFYSCSPPLLWLAECRRQHPPHPKGKLFPRKKAFVPHLPCGDRRHPARAMSVVSRRRQLRTQSSASCAHFSTCLASHIVDRARSSDGQRFHCRVV